MRTPHPPGYVSLDPLDTKSAEKKTLSIEAGLSDKMGFGFQTNIHGDIDILFYTSWKNINADSSKSISTGYVI